MLKMYRSANRAVPVQNIIAEPMPQTPVQPPQEALRPQNNEPVQQTGEGRLVAVVSTIRGLYPVPNAKVTVFTGDYQNMDILDTAVTDQSGKSKAFLLPTPDKNLSLASGETALPYASYNMLVEADGYLDNIHINIPVFSGVTSLQRSNMMLRETAGADKNPQIFDESSNYDL